MLNEVINKRKSKSPLPSSFASEGKTITDPVEIADKFCNLYFPNIGPNLARTIREVNSSFSFFLGDVNHPPINLQPTDPCELESICSMFDSRKAPGYDNISMRVIKHSFHLISAPLANIINLSLQKGIFPDKLKIAKMIPIYKADVPGQLPKRFYLSDGLEHGTLNSFYEIQTCSGIVYHTARRIQSCDYTLLFQKI